MWRCSLVRCGGASAATLVPCAWREHVPGWRMQPSSVVAEGDELSMSKTFDFLDHGAQYVFLGSIMAMASELHCMPAVQWFYTQLSFTVPPTPVGATLAGYANTLEQSLGGMRNMSSGTGLAARCGGVDAAADVRARARATSSFCWMLTDSRRQTGDFMSRTFVQWYHRADYLVTRCSREKREFRPDVSMSQVVQNGQERRRRMLRRQARTAATAAATSSGSTGATSAPRRRSNDAKPAADKDGDDDGAFDVSVADVLPREWRESMERDSDGMDDVRLLRPDQTRGGWQRTHRNNLPI